MTKKTYSEKLKDPRWQKKRLEILNRDEWTCQMCYDKDRTLHVHHKYYNKESEFPWEIEDKALVTLCEECHESETVQYKVSADALIEGVKVAGFFSNNVAYLANAFKKMEMQHMHDVVATAYGYAISDPQMQSLIIQKYFEMLEKKSDDNFKF